MKLIDQCFEMVSDFFEIAIAIHFAINALIPVVIDRWGCLLVIDHQPPANDLLGEIGTILNRGSIEESSD
jgi:hypothetical protein